MPTTITSAAGADDKTVEVLGAYTRPAGFHLHGFDGHTATNTELDTVLVVTDGGLDHAMYVHGDAGWYWAGALHPAAADRFDATPPGGTFQYRNRTHPRLTDDAVAELLANEVRCVGMIA